jgi:glycosyltransferase involved in cell wall biosynthesis
LKYWLLTTEYPPAHGGGISTYCFFTAKMLAANGYAVSIFVNDDGKQDIDIDTPGLTGIRLIRFNSNRDRLEQSLGYTARLSYAFAGVIKKFIEAEGKPDCIESQDYLGIAYYITQFKHAGYPFLAGVPVILTLHSPAFVYLSYNKVPVYRFPDFWTCEMEKQTIAAADGLISPTNYMLNEIQKEISLPSIPIATIANPFKPSYTAQPGFTRHKIVYYGKLSPQKGSFELLAYFKELWDAGFAHALHIVGGTDIVFHPEMKTMGQLLHEWYGPYVEKKLLQLHGKINPAAIENELQDAHVVIVPSIVDNMPYVVMETMSLGKIVLASTQGGQREMLEEGISGFLFDHQKPGSFTGQLTKILALSDEAVQRIGAAACQRVEQLYSFEHVFGQKNNFLQTFQTNKNAGSHFPFLQQEKIQHSVELVSVPSLLSIVIPFFNMGRYIDDCVQSIKNATYKNIELLIIDDGSTDAASLKKLDRLAAQDNTTVVHRKNCGLADTRNYGAAAARGEFLAFLDADDKVAPDYYEKAVAALVKNANVFFVGAWVQYFENSKALWPAFTPQPPYVLAHNPVNSSSLVYKRSAFLTGGLNDKKVGYGLEDYDSVIQMMSKGFNGIVLPEKLFYYRVRSRSMFRDITREKLMYSNSYIAGRHQQYYTNFAVPVINLLNANGPGYLFDNPGFAVHINTTNKPGNIYFARLKAIVKKNETLKRLALRILKIKSSNR